MNVSGLKNVASSTTVAGLKTVASLSITSAGQLSVEYCGKASCAIHPIWLRERCQDAQSMDVMTGQRLNDPSDFDLDLSYAATSESDTGVLSVRFSDGHQAIFDAEDILAEARLPPGEFDVPRLEIWTGALQNLPRAAWRYDSSAPELAAWVTTFLKWGFIIFSGVPATHHEVLKVAATFGFTRDTNFGAVFDVRSTPNASDLAYTSVKLDPHTDNPYRSPVPGVQLLHCLANDTTGGLSTLVDGCAVAQALRERDPDAFEIMSSTSVRFRYRDKQTELVASAAPIELDSNGGVKSIHFSPRLDFVPLLPLQDLTAYYRARKAFDGLLRCEEFEIRFLLDKGDLVMFDNCRLLHGRTGFDPQEGLRHLQGCYIDIDGPRSLYRVLRRNIADRSST